MERNNQRVVIALATALGLSLLAIAFLLGRISAKPAVIAVPVPPAGALTPGPQTSGVLPAPGDAATPDPGGAPLPAADSFAPAVVRETATVPAALPVLAPRVSPSADQQQIAAYFSQIDRIEDMGAGDPQAFATSVVQSMSSGDFSSFDDLLARARAQRQRLQSMAPPRACVEHHRLALSLAGDSVAMLERLKSALVKGDSTALLSLATEGKTLETQANQLKSLGESIKRQAGL